MKRKQFDGKNVLITGASSGIGKHTAIEFVNSGVRTIILVARSGSKLIELEKIFNKTCSSKVVVYPCDVSNKTAVIKMGKNILERFGYIDVLVNNAGFGLYGEVKSQSIEEIESITYTNYLGTVYCTKVFLDSMLSRKSGHIVNVASVGSKFWSCGLSGLLWFKICHIRVFGIVVP